ncbi:MAG: BTAD domain-containing putative transcriptional regulator [Burkholderiales bacterium]
MHIYAFGRFSLLKDGVLLRFTHKAPKKPISLLKALIALGGRDVSSHQLTDALWPDEPGDAAHHVLAVNVHRLRRLLGAADGVIVRDGRMSLDPRVCWVDVWTFQRLLGDAALAPHSERAALLERGVGLYRGVFLPGDADEPWSLAMRERLRRAFIRLCAELGRLHEESGRWGEAIECYQRAIESEELAEEFYQGLMRCYAHLGRRAEGVCVYRRLRQMLSVILGITVSPATEELLRELLS